MFPLMFLAVALQFDPSLLVKINVEGDQLYTQSHSISIRSQEGGRSRSIEERDARVWIATRTWEVGSQSVRSTECPAVRTIALSFGELPPVQIAPSLLAIMPGEGASIPPTIKDGFVTSLTFRTLTRDGSDAEVEIRRGNAYRHWGHDAVASLIPCWGPLTP